MSTITMKRYLKEEKILIRTILLKAGI